MENSRPILTDRQKKKWAPLFDPRKVKVSEWRLNLKKIMLKDSKLKQYGQNITNARAKIKKKADNIANLEKELAPFQISSLSNKVAQVHKVNSKKQTSSNISSFENIERDSSLSRKKRNKKMNDLSIYEKIDLIHQVMIQKYKQAEVAE